MTPRPRTRPAAPRRAPRALATLSTLAALAACNDPNPAEVRDRATAFPLRASWSAAAAPVGTAVVRADLAIKEYLGSRMEAAVTLTGGAPNTTYQWRIFRGDCATTAAAPNATTPTGLWLFATVQSYPDVTTGATGTGTAKAVIAGALDSLTAYSVRVRPSQTATAWNGTSPIACGDLRRQGA